MKITKRHLCDMPSCYAAAAVQRDGKTLLLLAPDALGPCYAFDSETYEREAVWEEPGGTMAIVAAPGGNGDFLAVQRFFPGFQAQNAEIIYAHYENGEWRVKALFQLPYVHRFDILERGGVRYLLCATLCTTKKNETDWSSPGGLYAAELPADLSKPLSLVQIADGMTRNHGFWRVNQFTALTSCDQGIYEVRLPEKRGGNWVVHKIIDKPASDIALCDIDGDGVDEIAVIESFHGSQFNIYRKGEKGYSLLYQYPHKTEFLHVVWGGKIRGQPVFIGGCRGGNKELFFLRWQNGKIKSQVIDSGAGPANVSVINEQNRDLILTANHEIGEGAVYIVED
jgi:hypothetical protein